MANDFLIKLDSLKMAVASESGLKPLVKNAELELPPRQSVGIVGESGSGKTLTVTSILGITQFLPGVTSGELWLAYDGSEQNVWHDSPWSNGGAYDRRKYFSWQKRISSRMKRFRGRKISIIFQKAKSSLNPYLKIKNQIYESLQMAGEGKNYDRMIEWLSNCGFSTTEAVQIADQYPHQLSGGQAQRAVMAVTLSSQAETVIADEPTTGLDAKLQVETLVFMKKMLDKYQRSAIIISHHLQSLAKFTDTCYVMYKGLTVEKGPTLVILRAGGENHPYTQKLQGEVETGGEVGQILSAGVEGCPYYSNCQVYSKMPACQQKRCREIEPPKFLLENSHFIRCWEFER